MKQVTGEAVYIDDMPHFEGELVAAPVLSTKARATIINIDDSKALKVPGVYGFITAKDLPSKYCIKNVL